MLKSDVNESDHFHKPIYMQLLVTWPKDEIWKCSTSSILWLRSIEIYITIVNFNVWIYCIGILSKYFCDKCALWSSNATIWFAQICMTCIQTRTKTHKTHTCKLEDNHFLICSTGSDLDINIPYRPSSIGIPIIEIRRTQDGVIFKMVIIYPWKAVFILRRTLNSFICLLTCILAKHHPAAQLQLRCIDSRRRGHYPLRQCLFEQGPCW